MYRLVAIVMTLLTAVTEAKPVLTVTCSEPTGHRYDYVQGSIESSTDGFSGVNPVFVVDDEKPKKLLVIWGPANPARALGFERRANEATIISATPDKITAVRIDDANSGVVHMYSLYPVKGLVFFTQHRYLNFSGGQPNSATYYVRCTFTPS